MIENMEKLEEIVEISGACFWNIVRATVEVPQEPRMDLIGKRESNNGGNKVIYRLINTYPILTLNMKPTGVDYANLAARSRLIEMDNAMVEIGSPYRIIGQCHHHIPSKVRNVICEPSEKWDMESVETEMERLRLDYFIELIGVVRRHNYRKPREIGYEISSSKQGINLKLSYTEKKGFDLDLRGFKFILGVDKKGHIKAKMEGEIPLHLMRVKIGSREVVA